MSDPRRPDKFQIHGIDSDDLAQKLSDAADADRPQFKLADVIISSVTDDSLLKAGDEQASFDRVDGDGFKYEIAQKLSDLAEADQVTFEWKLTNDVADLDGGDVKGRDWKYDAPGDGLKYDFGQKLGVADDYEEIAFGDKQIVFDRPDGLLTEVGMPVIDAADDELVDLGGGDAGSLDEVYTKVEFNPVAIDPVEQLGVTDSDQWDNQTVIDVEPIGYDAIIQDGNCEEAEFQDVIDADLPDLPGLDG